MPNIAVDVSDAAGGRELRDFLAAHSNEVVRLKIECYEYENDGQNPCFTERSIVDITSEPRDGQYTWMWLFLDEPCFGAGDDGADFAACRDEVLLWVDPRTDRTSANISNIRGAGSVGIQGPWHVKTPFGGWLYGPDVEGFELSPADR
jgi:hypothetical protein